MAGRPPIEAFKRRTARRLRSHSTDAEKRLWSYLKRIEIDGTHFRRQVPIGDYVVDFACLAARLVIEIDGSQHQHAQIVEYDKMRTTWLEAEGYRVIRFWNNDVAQNIDGVLDVIHEALYGSREAVPHSIKHTRER